MRRGIILSFVFLFLALPLVSSLSIDMPTNISQGETVIASIQGNFLDSISKSNIEFYRDYVQTTFDYDLARIGDTYYIYFQTLNKAQNNYSISITGVRYYVGSQISNADITQNFTLNSEQADFYINKGSIITYGNFSIKLQNLNADTITVNLDTSIDSGSTYGFFDFLFKNTEFSPGESITLLSGEIRDLDIVLDGVNETTIRTITLSSDNTEYYIPVYVILQTPTNVTNTTTTSNNTTTSTDNTSTIVNETTNESSGSSFWDLFKSNNTEESSTDVNETTNTTIIINGTVTNTTLKTCSQLGGEICTTSNETCDGTSVTAKDNYCCIGTCVEKTKSNTGKIIGWSIIGLIIILLIMFKMKLNKTKRKNINLLKIPKRRRF